MCFREVQGELSGQCEVMGLRIVEGVALSMRHESVRSEIQTVSADHGFTNVDVFERRKESKLHRISIEPGAVMGES